jgi:natural product precursor
MKRTQVADSTKLKLNKKTIVQLEDKQLETVIGGCKGGGGGERTTCSSHLCSGV